MSKGRLLFWALAIAATGAYAYWKWPAPPRTLEQVEREEREIMAGTRRGPPPPAAALREERARAAPQPKQRDDSEQLVSLFERCHHAVKREFMLARQVTVDDDRLPPSGYVHLSTYRGERIVGLSDRPPDPAYYSVLAPPLSGTYVVSGTVKTGSGPGANYKSYECRIWAKPPLYIVRSVDIRAVK